MFRSCSMYYRQDSVEYKMLSRSTRKLKSLSWVKAKQPNHSNNSRGTRKQQTIPPFAMINIKICRERNILRVLVVLPVLLLLLYNFSLVQKITLPYKEMSEKWDDAPAQVVETRNPRIESSKIIQENEIDWSDRNFAKGEYQSPIVIESHRLVFFQVAKVGASIFKRLFRRMMGYSDWLETMPHQKQNKADGLKHLKDYSRDQQLEMMTSPNWTRAIFVRDPIERTLSGYLNKGHDKGGRYLKQSCCGMTKRNQTIPADKAEYCHHEPFTPFTMPVTPENFPFKDFVDHVMTDCDDIHWQPQHKRMNMDNWKLINFVGKMENVMNDTHLLLKRIGAFEEFGASGWGEFRNESIFQSNAAGHQTGSSKKVKEYYTPELFNQVLEHVRGDYEMELFDFTIPADLS